MNNELSTSEDSSQQRSNSLSNSIFNHSDNRFEFFDYYAHGRVPHAISMPMTQNQQNSATVSQIDSANHTDYVPNHTATNQGGNIGLHQANSAWPSVLKGALVFIGCDHEQQNHISAPQTNSANPTGIPYCMEVNPYSHQSNCGCCRPANSNFVPQLSTMNTRENCNTAVSSLTQTQKPNDDKHDSNVGYATEHESCMTSEKPEKPKKKKRKKFVPVDMSNVERTGIDGIQRKTYDDIPFAGTPEQIDTMSKSSPSHTKSTTCSTQPNSLSSAAHVRDGGNVSNGNDHSQAVEPRVSSRDIETTRDVTRSLQDLIDDSTLALQSSTTTLCFDLKDSTGYVNKNCDIFRYNDKLHQNYEMYNLYFCNSLYPSINGFNSVNAVLFQESGKTMDRNAVRYHTKTKHHARSGTSKKHMYCTDNIFKILEENKLPYISLVSNHVDEENDLNLMSDECGFENPTKSKTYFIIYRV